MKNGVAEIEFLCPPDVGEITQLVSARRSADHAEANPRY